MPWKNGNPVLYTVWRGMLHRCYNPKAKQFKDYGGRGIRVCPEWKNDFYRFQADMLPTYRKGLTIERTDNDDHYTPKNCCWATRKEQQRNQRVTRRVTIEGKEYVAVELADIAGIKTDNIVERALQGLTYKEVISSQKRLNLDGFKLGAKASSIARKSRTHCKNGHKYTLETTGWRTVGKYSWRVCLVCKPRSAPLRRVRLYLKGP